MGNRNWDSALLRALAALALAGAVVGVGAMPASAADAPPYGSCDGQDPAVCDVDGDHLSNAVELIGSGSETGLTFDADRNGNGVPDALEIQSCKTPTCVSDPTRDTDRNKMPDWLQRLVCSTDTCTDFLRDTDGDSIPDFAEYLIAGDRTSATSVSDFNANAKSDAAEIMACFGIKVDPAKEAAVAAAQSRDSAPSPTSRASSSAAIGATGSTDSGRRIANATLPFTGWGAGALGVLALGLIAVGVVGVRQRRLAAGESLGGTVIGRHVRRRHDDGEVA